MTPEDPETADQTFEILWSVHADAALQDAEAHDTIRDSLPSAELFSLPNFIIHGEEVDENDLSVGAVLGQGGMGVVFLAHQNSLDRDVAVKQIRKDAPGAAAKALIHEARIMGALEHPNIIPVHALGVDENGVATLVMKRVEGTNWGVLIGDADHPGWAGDAAWPDDPIERHVSVLTEVCKGLQFAHGRGFLHRDLKPDNIMLGPFGEVYVLDWGLACPLGPSTDRFRIVGTPAYMAPEMLDPHAARAVQTDIYLLGACLFEALTGHPPHQGSSIREVLHAAFRSTPLDFGLNSPEELTRICSKAMASDPAQRYPTVAALRIDLLAFIQHRGSSRLASVALERVGRIEELWAADPEDESAQALASEALFGLRQAQEEWADNPIASEGLERLLICRCQRRLTLRDLAGALEDLSILHSNPEPRNPERIQELQAQLDAGLQDRKESDPKVSRRQRVIFLLSCLAFMLLASGLQMESIMGDRVEFDAGWLFQLALIHNVIQGGLLLLLRERLMNTRFNRRIAAVEVATAGAVLANRGLGWVMGTAVGAIFVSDMLILTLCVLICGAFLRRSMALWALPLLLTSGLTAAFPHRGGEFFALAILLCGLIVLLTPWESRSESRS